MSDYDDRGAYTPPSDRLAFDPRQPVRGGGPAPVTLIVSGLVLASLAGGVFFLYRDGFKHREEAPALVGAPVADARTPAPPADADSAAPPGLTVDRTASAAPPPAFGPPPAQALPPVATQAAAPTAAPPVATPLPPAVRTPPPPKVVMLQPDAPPAADAPPRQAATTPALADLSSRKAVAPKLAAATPKPAVASPARKLAVASVPKRAVAAPAFRLAMAAPPAERPVVRHASTMTIGSLADAAIAQRPRDHAPAAKAFRPRADEAPAPIAAPARRFAAAPEAKPAPAPAPTIAGATGWVQIGAFSSEALADQGWHDLARLEPAAMAGKGRAVQPFTRDDGAVLYRAYVTGFASVPAAQSFCSDLRAAGKGCIVK